ncbi:MAG: glycoside hydrolase [Verrucomicrobiales bacterium]|nr:glycoside hydrolase [Verrucomicrobiales bacterium]
MKLAILFAVFVMVLNQITWAQKFVLFEPFEENFPQDNGWTVGGVNATWGQVTNGFGNRVAVSGSYFAYCAAIGNAGTAGAPVYPNDMSGYMQRIVNLAGYTAATLSFWYALPSLDESGLFGRDYFQVLVDGQPVFGPTSSIERNWQPVTIDLRRFLGRIHTLKFEFVSGENFPPRFEGAYLDNILVVGQKTLFPNVLVNDPTADKTRLNTQHEPSLAVAADATVIVAFNDSGSLVQSTNRFTGWAVSKNGGTSFTDSGTLPSGVYGDAGDPVLAHDLAIARTYLATIIVTNRLFGSTRQTVPGSRVHVFRSSQIGPSFDAPINATPGFVEGDHLDKPWLAVDNSVGHGQGNLYLVFRNFSGEEAGSQQDAIYLTRSTDGGLTWGPQGGFIVAAGGQGAYVVVGPDHTVYVFWLSFGQGARILMRKSSDQGVTFGVTITVARISSSASKGDLGLNIRTDSFPRAAVNPLSGDLYVVYNDKGRLSNDLGDVFFTKSADGGSTWSAPMVLNQDYSLHSQWFPTITVAPDGRDLFVGWYDRRLEVNNIEANTTYGIFGSISETNVLFGLDFRIGEALFSSPTISDPSVASYLGDYIQAIADSETVYFAWTDSRSGNSDIRLAKVPIPDRFSEIQGASDILRVRLNTNPGRRYTIEASPDLHAWNTLTNFWADDFTFEMRGSSANAGPHTLYRALAR